MRKASAKAGAAKSNKAASKRPALKPATVALRAIKGGKIILLAAPAAREYYPRIGFNQHPSAWIVDAGGPISE